MRYDILVLGSGPAGLSAAVAARGRNKSVLLIGNAWKDSPLAKAERVENYLGLPGATGEGLLSAFHDHALAAGVELVAGRATSLMAWKGFQATVGNQVYQARSLILAPGVSRQNKFPGEEALLGRGVSYCATCDGMLYRGRSVVVVGRSADAPQEANYLKSIGCEVVYVAPKQPEELAEGIAFVQGNQVELKGEMALSAVVVNGQELPCTGAFILRPAVAPTDLLPALETQAGVIKVDRHMATNLPGVFAAGDCTGAPLQVSKAVGEGLIAALAAAEYLDHLPHE